MAIIFQSKTLNLLEFNDTTGTLIVKLPTGNNNNLQQWQNSNGTVLASISSNGTVYMGSTGSANIATFYNGTNGYGAGNIAYNGTFNINGANIGFPYTSSGAVLAVNATHAGAVPLTSRAYASQTADLQQWQNSSGSVLAKVDKDGNITNVAQISGYNMQIGGGNFAGITYNGIQTPYSVTTTPTLVVRTLASQTGDAQQWTNSANAVLAKVDSSGKISAPIFQSTVAGTAYIVTGSNNNAIRIQTNAVANVGLQVRGEASQTANLQEWQDSTGAVIANMQVNGNMHVSYLDSLSSLGTYLYTGNNEGFQLINRDAGHIPLKIKGFASQTGDLQQWQDSSGTVLASINNAGRVNASTIGTLNNWVFSKEESSGGQIRLKKSTAAPTEFRASDFGQIYLRDGTNAGTLKLVIVAGASGAETTILDNIPQS